MHLGLSPRIRKLCGAGQGSFKECTAFPCGPEPALAVMMTQIGPSPSGRRILTDERKSLFLFRGLPARRYYCTTCTCLSCDNLNLCYYIVYLLQRRSNCFLNARALFSPHILLFSSASFLSKMTSKWQMSMLNLPQIGAKFRKASHPPRAES